MVATLAFATPHNPAARRLASTPQVLCSRRSTLGYEVSEHYSGQVTEHVLEAIYRELLVDWAGLWEISADIQNAYPAAEWQGVRRLTLDVV